MVRVVGTPLSAAKAALAVIAPVPPCEIPIGEADVMTGWAPRAESAALAVMAPVPPRFSAKGAAVVSAACAPRFARAAALLADCIKESMSVETVMSGIFFRV